MSRSPNVPMLQWNKILKLIRDADKSSIAVLDLVADLNLPIDQIPSLEKTITYLQRRGDIEVVIGGRRSGKVGKVVTITERGRSRRELLGDQEEVNVNDWADKYSEARPTNEDVSD